MATRKGKKSVQVINRKGATQWAAAAVAAAAGLLAKQQLAQAAVNGPDTWSAASPDTWGNSSNWSVTSANIPPINGDDLTFNVGAGTFVNSSTISSANLLSLVNSITLTAAIGGGTTFSAFDNTQALTLTGAGITNSSTNSVIFNELLAVGNNDSTATFNAGTKSFFAANTAGFVVGSSSTLTFTGTSTTGTISLASASMTLGAGSNLVNTTATTSLSGPLSLLGGNNITIGSGTFNVGVSGSVGSGNVTDFGTGSAITIAGGTLTAVPNAMQVSLGASDVLSISAGAFKTAGNGIVSFGAGGSLIATGGLVSLGSNTELAFGSNSLFSVGGSAIVSTAGAVLLGNSSSMLVTGGTSNFVVISPYFSLGNGVLVSVSNGSLTTGYNNWGTNDIFSVSGGSVSIGGNYVLSGTNDSVIVTGGSFTIAGFNSSNTTVSVAGGSVSLGNGNTPPGTFTVNVGSAVSSTNSAVLRLTTPGSFYKGNFTIESGQTGAGTIAIQNPNTSTASTISTDLLSALQVNNNFTIANLGTTGGTVIFELFAGFSATSDTTKTLTFDSSGNTNSELFNAGAAASNFLGSYSLRGGGTVSLTAAIPSFSSGKTLSGAGTWTQPAGTANTLVMAAGSTLNPGGYNGSSAGVLVITNNLSVAPASNLLFSLNGGNSSSAVAVGSTGTLFFGGTSSGKVNLSLNNVTLPPLNSSTTYELFSYGTYAGDPSADLTQDFSLTLNGATPDPSQTTLDVINNGAGSQIDVVVASVPEPASISLLGLGAVGLLGRRRKKVKAKA